jgi:GDPmannose 4,6-dehydratase
MKILISGITGQDGSILAHKMYRHHEVHGIIRRSAAGRESRWRIGQLEDFGKVSLHYGDLTDPESLRNIVSEVKPDWVFNLAAQSQVGISFKTPAYTMQATGVGACNFMDAVFSVVPDAKFYQASSSEMWGQTTWQPQDEITPLLPISPYAVAKVMAHNYGLMKRKEGYFVAIGILNNHESEWRGDNFVTTKIAKAAARKEQVRLGYLGAIRDWGYAPEYVDGMVMMMHHDTPDTFVLGTNEGHTVKEFVVEAYRQMGLDAEDMVIYDERFKRSIEAGPLIGNYAKAQQILGWEPKTKFRDLITILLNHWRKK